MKISPIFIFITVIICSFTGASLTPIDTEDAVTFTIKNFGLNTSGSFRGLKGNINWDATNFNACKFDVSIDANTINTGIDARDNHLRKEEYFDVEKYPLITFISTQISNGNISGNLTVKGVSKNISFPFIVAALSSG